MNARIKIIRASEILESQIRSSILLKEIDLEDPKLKILLKDGPAIYIQYNNHEQYSYNVVFSNAKLDRCRFDNYDTHWEVKSKPHHFHPRNLNTVTSSLMNGNPDHDLRELINLLKVGRLHNGVIH